MITYKHLLYPILKALLLQLIFSIPTTSLLIIFLKYSQELRDFCGFDVVPDASEFTRFKRIAFTIHRSLYLSIIFSNTVLHRQHIFFKRNASGFFNCFCNCLFIHSNFNFSLREFLIFNFHTRNLNL